MVVDLPAELVLSQAQHLEVVPFQSRPPQAALWEMGVQLLGSSPAGGLRTMLGCWAALRAALVSRPAPPRQRQELDLRCR